MKEAKKYIYIFMNSLWTEGKWACNSEKGRDVDRNSVYT